MNSDVFPFDGSAGTSHLASSRPNLTGIIGPPQSETASAPATAIKSAQETNSFITQHVSASV